MQRELSERVRLQADQLVPLPTGPIFNYLGRTVPAEEPDSEDRRPRKGRFRHDYDPGKTR